MPLLFERDKFEFSSIKIAEFMQILAQIMQIYADYAYIKLFYPMPIFCRSIAKTNAKTEMKSVDSE